MLDRYPTTVERSCWGGGAQDQPARSAGDLLQRRPRAPADRASTTPVSGAGIYGLALDYEDPYVHVQLRRHLLLGLLVGKRKLEKPLAGKSTSCPKAGKRAGRRRVLARRVGEKWPPAEAGVRIRVGRRAGRHKKWRSLWGGLRQNAKWNYAAFEFFAAFAGGLGAAFFTALAFSFAANSCLTFAVISSMSTL